MIYKKTNMKYIISALFLFLFANLVYADEIAITFDDLPGQKSESSENQKVSNAELILLEKGDVSFCIQWTS